MGNYPLFLAVFAMKDIKSEMQFEIIDFYSQESLRDRSGKAFNRGK